MERVIQLKKQLYENDLYRHIEAYLGNELDLETQEVESPDGVILQVREKKNWKKYSGMGVTLNVRLSASNDLLIVDFGQSKWLDKAAAGAAGWYLFAPLFVTGAIGLYRQSSLPKKVLKSINEYIEMNESDMDKVADSTRKCPHCGSSVELSATFCTECGGKINA